MISVGSFIFEYYLLDELPFELVKNDDVATINAASTLTYSDILGDIIFKDSGKDTCIFQYIFKRPVHFFSLKVLNDLFDFNPPYFYIFRAVIITVIVVFFSLLIYQANSSIYFMVLSSAFLITVPPLFFSTMWISDAEILAQLFLLIVAFIFLKFGESLSKLNLKSVYIQILLLLFSLLAIRSKETGRIIALLMPLFIFFFKRELLKKLSVIMLILLFMVIPQSVQQSGINKDNFNIAGVWYKVFQYGGGDVSAEIKPPIIDLFHYKTTPGSIFGVLGFFLIWFFIILFIYVWIKERKCQLNLFKDDCFAYFFIWFILIVAFYPFNVYRVDNYYLVSGIIPFLLWYFTSMSSLLKNRNRVIIGLFSLAVIITIMIHAYHIHSTIRGVYGGRYIYVYEIDKGIYDDVIKRDTSSEEFYQFSINNRDLLYKTLNTRNGVLFGKPYEIITANITIDFNEKEIVKQINYAVSLNESLHIPSHNIKLIKKFTLCGDKKTAYCKIKSQIFNRTTDIFLFKVITDGSQEPRCLRRHIDNQVITSFHKCGLS